MSASGSQHGSAYITRYFYPDVLKVLYGQLRKELGGIYRDRAEHNVSSPSGKEDHANLFSGWPTASQKRGKQNPKTLKPK